MTPGQLVKAVAIALDVSEETVVQHDRNLVVAGLRTKGGRGPSAPEVTPLDAARLVLAVLGSIRVKDSVAVVHACEKERVTTRPGEEYRPLPVHTDLPQNHTFVDGLAAIIEQVNTPLMFENFDQFARRFSALHVTVSTSRVLVGNSIGFVGNDFFGVTTYSEKRAEKPQKDDRPNHERWLDFYGVEQDRRIRGNCLMILGFAFQKNSIISARDVYKAWSAAAKKKVA